MKRKLVSGGIFLLVLGGVEFAYLHFEKRAVVEAAAVQAPRFEVDPLWPKPLPNHWIVGQIIGVSVDAQDHIWIVHRSGFNDHNELFSSYNPPEAECCSPAPPVLEFDQAGNLLRHWGGPGEGYDWPVSNHGITIDYKGNVWIGGNGRGTPPGAARGGRGGRGQIEEGQTDMTGYWNDNMVLKFTQDGKFLMQIGKPAHTKGSNDVENLRLPAKTFVDPKANEVYVADGYGNHRVIVYDADTGKYKRHWGAYGHKPDDINLGPYRPDAPLAQQFRNPVHCAELSNDNLLYVCDRSNDRIQVFKPDGTYVKEMIYEKQTLAEGSVWDLAFSKDPAQKYIFLLDGANNKVRIILRDTLQVLTSFGGTGRQPGQFLEVHSIALDSKSNLYTTETAQGKRLQKFVYKGIGPVTAVDQGVAWPKTSAKK
jgi:DNA-binding beta-propeller fold protein YncE